MHAGIFIGLFKPSFQKELRKKSSYNILNVIFKF